MGKSRKTATGENISPTCSCKYLLAQINRGERFKETAAGENIYPPDGIVFFTTIQSHQKGRAWPAGREKEAVAGEITSAAANT